MLVLSRKKNEGIVINNDITIRVVEIRGDKVRLGIVAPKEATFHRQEVFDAIHGVRQARSWSAEEQAFLKAIEASPDDIEVRLVFADWLEERGDPLGEHLRLQCSLARLPPGDQRRQDLERRERLLWAEHGADWQFSLPTYLLRVSLKPS
jgi:carbon storage regulator